MEDNDNDKRPPVQQFLDDYQDELNILHEEAKSIFMECYNDIDEDYPEDDFTIIEETIKAIRTLSSIDKKIREIKKARGKCRKYFKELIDGRNADMREKFRGFEYKIEEIISTAKRYAKSSSKEAKSNYQNIKRCPFGEQENRTKNALLFQEKVLELIDWLFVNEMERMDLSEIEDGSQKRDGGYRVLDDFDTKKRCGFPFKHLFVECKNYKKPSYRDLMQVFSYTLLCQESKIFAMPLSLLITRENPDANSTTWKLRRVIFNRRIEKEERLILFLDEKDLEEMVQCKAKGDPASVLKEKIEDLGNWNIKQGAD